jgi:hypothetical protein
MLAATPAEESQFRSAWGPSNEWDGGALDAGAFTGEFPLPADAVTRGSVV